MSQEDGRRRTPLDRIVTLTDGVAAIAMTLLVLPLVELAPEAERDGLGPVLGSHVDVLFAFGLSFVLIYRFWAAHARALQGQVETAPWVAPLNLAWLLAIAFLPFPTALIGGRTDTPSVFLYLVTMLVLSIITPTIAHLAARSGAGAGQARLSRRQVVLRWSVPAIFGACALVSLVNPGLALWGQLSLAVLSVLDAVATRAARRRSGTTRGEEPRQPIGA